MPTNVPAAIVSQGTGDCPVCGDGKLVDWELFTEPPPQHYRVSCARCGLMGGPAPDIVGAVRNWNAIPRRERRS